MPEVVADFGNIVEDCDPLVMLNCPSASNATAHAFRIVVENDELTNEFIRGLMERNYVGRLSTDLTQRTFSMNVRPTADSFVYPPTLKTRTYLEFDGTLVTDDLVTPRSAGFQPAAPHQADRCRLGG